LVAPVSSAVHINRDNDEFRPWEDNQSTTASTAPTSGKNNSTLLSVFTHVAFPVPTTISFSSSPPASAVTRNRKQPIVMRWDNPAEALDAPQPESGPSRDELLEEVQRLREYISVIAPPAYD
jgi:hypothetical protein